ncbi:histidine phosphatase family protein [Meiothermus sp. QL-1]|uniref:histidine phosphatase family protein n=1 Tax=Meiothermus sp. QL-1 TaxID=2058095 RepID=UPI000E0AF647|nr:histidine phosphatase family protein [Meiothermus sp. QL-1]RDI94734.1 histidine phosphatase family protein [Meiothermus sp. QL-1]
MGEVWLVRHGETLWNAEGRLTGWSDVPLSPKGEDQARRLGDWLRRERFEGVLASDLRRAVETARLAYAEPELQLEALREIDFGELDGLPWAALPEVHRQALLAFEGFQAPGGESVEAFRRRVFGVLEGLGVGRYLVFTHGGVLRLVLRALGRDTFLPPCAVVGVDWQQRRLLFVREGG